MSRMIFVNLPVRNLDRSVEFFTQLGFEFNPQFTDETATCMIISDDAFVMLLVESKFREFTPKPISDATTRTEVITSLSAANREEVDGIVDKALAVGGSSANEPMDLGFMYNRSFQDPDGHLWEVVYMDEAAMSQ